jgi:hypothetical protein
MARAIMQLPEPAPQILADLGVQRAERQASIQQQDPRIDGQGAGKRHPLALSAGELAWKSVRKPRKLDEIEQVADPFADRAFGRSLAARPCAQPEGDVVGNAHMLEQSVALEHEADAPFAQVELCGVGPAKEDPAGIGSFETGDDAQKRRLA